jgi:murein DD-endopeptidase MepM/ murein hydrolase activator NlpD
MVILRTRGQRKNIWAGFLVLVLVGCAPRAPVGLTGHKVLSGFQGELLSVASRASVVESKAGSTQSYVVKPGDSLWKIAQSFGLGFAQLAQNNNLDPQAPLQVGTLLTVPKDSSTGVAGKNEGTRHVQMGTYPLLWPVKGVITSRYGKRWGRAHEGIDIGAPSGSPIMAAAAGEVMYAAPHGSYGNLVILRHDDGLVTLYAHNRKNLVKKGEQVDAQQVIAHVGSTGRSTGPHLHFEVRKGTHPQNPAQYLPP